MLRWKRSLRTSSSERFVAVRDGSVGDPRQVAMADLHYLKDGTVSGTIVLDGSAGWTEEQVPDLLASLDEDMLPNVDQALGTLHYTVVMGEILGSYDIEPETLPAPKPDKSRKKPRGGAR